MDIPITLRDIMLYLDYLYDGDDLKIKKHIADRTPMDMDELIKIVAERNSVDLITRADGDYPKELENRKNPPYVISRAWADMISIRKEYANVN